MDGLDRIEQRIRADARAEIASIEAQSAEQLSELRKEYDARLEKSRGETLAKAKQAAQERRERLASAAQMEAKKLRLGAKQEVLGEAFDLALTRLCALPQERQVDFLARMAHEASPRGAGTLIFSAEDRALGMRVAEEANRRYDAYFTLSNETRPLRGGFILSQGDVEVNCSYEALIWLRRDALEHEVAKILFA